MSNAFYFGGSDSSDVDDDNLPYPTPLARSAFLTPDFSPTAYLSTLHDRHQTLEDLRGELRSRSNQLSKELLDLVNANYNDFLTLGSSLAGGEDKIEEVRLGLLAFKRDVEGVRKKIDEREREVSSLIQQRATARKAIAFGTNLLDFVERVNELEAKLMMASDGRRNGHTATNGPAGSQRDDDSDSSQDDDDEEEEDEDDDTHSNEDGDPASVSTGRLRKFVQQYLYIKHMAGKVGSDHPLIVAQSSRITRAHQTLMLDLAAATKQARAAGDSGKDRLLRLLAIHRDLGDSGGRMRSFA
ncbi:MAG: hypothetical protein M1825_005908 [Sarcosagium campestre]|nr:MAG: hypothetical protein M1825_005908 [Sarcosagium campestre]